MGLGLSRLSLGLAGVANALSRPNLLARPSEFDNAAWVKGSDLSITANNIVAPDGSVTAELSTINSSGGGIYQTVSVSPNLTYTFSEYVRLGTLAAADFKLAFRNDTAGSFIAADIIPEITPTSSGWVRVVYSFSTPPGCTTLRVYPFRNTAVSTGTFYLWGAKLELGADASFYRG